MVVELATLGRESVEDTDDQDGDLLVKPQLSHQHQYQIASLEEVFAVVDFFATNRVGRARGIGKLIRQAGGRVVAVQGCRVRRWYNRRCLIEAPRSSLDQIATTAKASYGHHLTHLHVLEPRLTWTFTCVAPDAPDVDEGTGKMFERLGIDIEWELKERRDAMNSTMKMLHQAIVVTLPGTGCLSELEAKVREWRDEYGGDAELLPGACLALI